MSRFTVLTLRGLTVRREQTRGKPCLTGMVLPLCLLLLISGLSACGVTTTGSAAAATPTALPTSTAVAATPTATPQPTAPLSTTAILDVRPASMSLVGHLDCTKGTAYTCAAEVIARSSNQGSMRWTSSTSVPGQVVFSPAGGVLAPGAQVLVAITVPLNACTRGLFAFHGPANTHTISWAC